HGGSLAGRRRRVRRRRDALPGFGTADRGGGCRDEPGRHATGEGVALHAHGARGRSSRGGGRVLLALAQWLAQDVRAFNVFGYITLRAVLAAMTAMAISLI